MAKPKKADTLKKYRARRVFTQTPEPRGVKKKSKNSALFVVHKHAASHLHYDVRLEIGGVLVSWAVPKGPPGKRGIKRLAIQTEDHPYNYHDFEGVIPEGNYGAGTVMVWDTGTFENIKEQHGKPVSLAQCLRNGQVEVNLYGKKLHGSYALVKTKLGWLMMKIQDKNIAKRVGKKVARNVSALTGRTMAQIRKDG